MAEVDVDPGPLDEDHPFLTTLSQDALTLMDATGAQDRTLSLMFADDVTIADLNHTWRGIDTPTDVLSFPLDEGDAVMMPPGEPLPLGDIVISVDTATRQAEDVGVTVLEMMRWLLVHGICHLHGYDHGEPEEAARMVAEEKRLLTLIAPGSRRPPTPYG